LQKCQHSKAPFAQRRQRLQTTWSEWEHEEMRRGYTVTAVPPSEVSEAAQKIARDEASTLRGYHSDRAGAIESEWRRRVDSVRAKYGELVNAMDDLRVFEGNRASFA
jgi:hypothetical protein